jgi:ParB family chromosome partitioning protein
LQLPPDAREALQQKKISEGHARAVLALKGDQIKQQELLELIINNHWSVRQAEQFVTSVKQGAESKRAKRATIAETPETKKLGKLLKTKVTVKRTAKGGRLEIHYKDDQELSGLLERFGKI